MRGATSEAENREKGFTLLELAMVILIIGLLTGGVLSAQHFIRQSELNAIADEMGKYRQALIAFEDKYQYLPGDFPNAADFWPTCDGTPTDCNGDGDGMITGTNQSESFRAIQQLAAANLIAGNFTGVYGGSLVLNGNIPASKYQGGGLSLAWVSATVNAEDDWGTQQGNAIYFGSPDSGEELPRAPILTPEDTLLLDRKLDDGLPDSGFLQANDNTPSTCVTGSAPDFTYNLAVEDSVCSFHFFFN